MEFSKIVEAIENAGYEARRYSGRGMYGAECLGVECSNPIKCVLDIVQEYCSLVSEAHEVSELVEALEGPSIDNMGRDSIVYWSGIEWEEEDEDEPDEDEESEEDEPLQLSNRMAHTA